MPCHLASPGAVALAQPLGDGLVPARAATGSLQTTQALRHGDRRDEPFGPWRATSLKSMLRFTYVLLPLALAACSGAPSSTPGGGDDPGSGTGAPPRSGDGGGEFPPVDAALEAATDGGAGGSIDGGGPAADAGDSGAGGPVAAGASRGTIAFHFLLGVSGSGSPGDSLTLDGDGYTDLIASNYVAGVMYGHLVAKYSPGMQLYPDYLYGSIFAQLLQENLATQLYVSSSGLIDSSPDQQAVMGAGQGGPYQINNYAADMVHGGYAPQGNALINYVAVQKNIGYAFADAATQYTKPTPPSFNDKYYGPMLTAYFHFNDYVALQRIGSVGGYTPQWEPAYDQALARFATLPGNFLEVLLNVAYNQGYYGPLVTSYSRKGATATAATIASVNDYGSVWGVSDTYQQYPYQVRAYLDELYDNPAPKTGAVPDNHVVFRVAGLGTIFEAVFQKLAYVDASAGYVFISQAQASAAFAAAVAKTGVAGDTLDLSNAGQRAQIFTLLGAAIATLETSVGTDFTATTLTAL
jgi:hypothetical protein